MAVSLFTQLDPATCRHLYLRLEVAGAGVGGGYVCVSCGTRFVIEKR